MAWNPNYPTPILDTIAEEMDAALVAARQASTDYYRGGVLTARELAERTGRKRSTIQKILMDRRFRDVPRLGGRFKWVGRTTKRTLTGTGEAYLFALQSHPMPEITYDIIYGPDV